MNELLEVELGEAAPQVERAPGFERSEQAIYSQYLLFGVSGSVFGEFRNQFLVQLKLYKPILMKYKQ